jgi:PAS domain S-box-containing protein
MAGGGLSLGARFNLILIAVFVMGAAVSWSALNVIMLKYAERQAATNADGIRTAMSSVRDYTREDVSRWLQQLQTEKDIFIPETVQAYSAFRVAAHMRAYPGYKNYVYREAAPNPTNVLDKADAFETDLVGQFEKDPAPRTGFRELNGQQYFYSAKPLSIQKQSCLSCHTTPETAPPAMLRMYYDGDPDKQHGFDWKLNQIVAAQIVYVPASQVIEHARVSTYEVLALFVTVFGLLILLINVLLRRTVLRPLKQLTAATEAVGQGIEEAQKFGEAGGGKKLQETSRRTDELGRLAGTFGLMAGRVRLRESELLREQEQLRRRETQLRTVIENAADAILVLDKQRNVTFANAATRTVLGVDPAAFIGTPLLDLVVPEDRERVSAATGAATTPRMRFSVIGNNGATSQLVEAAGTSLLADPVVRGIVLTIRAVSAE